MRGQSVGIFPVRNSSPEPVIAEIEKIMDSGEGGLSQSMIKFQSIGRLNSILVVSHKPEYLKRAGVWIARLDKSDTEGVNLKAYPLRYGNSKVVVALLNEMLLGGGQGTGGTLDNASSQVSPGAGISVSSSPGGGAVAALSGLPPSSGASGTVPTASVSVPLNTRGAPPAGGAMPGQDSPAAGAFGGGGTRSASGSAVLPNVRITADVTNNAVLVYANADSQRVVEQTIRQIDRPQRQIAIEATIAEVTLNDQLAYGVQFFIASQKGSISNTIAGVSPSNTGLDARQQRRQRRRRRAARARASRLQFPGRSREFAARNP